MHADWRYIMWSNERADSHVEQHHPELWPVFRNFERGIMRADVIRYVVLHDFGGLYCDLDYEFLRPYEFAGASLVLGMEFDVHHGDSFDQVSNFVMASAPQHPFWRDVLDDLIQRPPQTDNYHDVIKSTGPGLLTRVFFANQPQISRRTGGAASRLQPASLAGAKRATHPAKRRRRLRSSSCMGLVARAAVSDLCADQAHQAVLGTQRTNRPQRRAAQGSSSLVPLGFKAPQTDV